MSVVEADFGEPEATLFELPPIEKGGAITLSQVKNKPLRHDKTAGLLKAPQHGHGTVVSFAGKGHITASHFGKDMVVWTVEVDELEVEL